MKTSHQTSPIPRVVSIAMADGTDITSPEAQVRIARALLRIRAPLPIRKTPPAPECTKEAKVRNMSSCEVRE